MVSASAGTEWAAEKLVHILKITELVLCWTQAETTILLLSLDTLPVIDYPRAYQLLLPLQVDFQVVIPFTHASGVLEFWGEILCPKIQKQNSCSMQYSNLLPVTSNMSHPYLLHI